MHGFMQSMPIATSSYFEHLFKLSSSDVLGLYSFYLFSCIFMQVPVGMLFAKYGLRKIVLTSLCIAIVGSLIHQCSNLPIILVVSRLIIGVGFATSYLSAIYVAMNFFSARYLVLMVGIVESITTLGSIVAATPFYALLENVGWHIANLIILIVLSVIFLLAYIFIPKQPKERIKSKEVGYGFISELKKIITNKAVILLMLYAFLNWLIMMSFAGFWIRDYMVNIHSYSVMQSLSLSNIYWAAFLIGGLIIGGFTNTFKKLKIAAFILSNMTVITFLVMAIPIVFDYTQLVIVCIFAGLSGVCVMLSFAFIPYVTQGNYNKDMTTSVINMSIIAGGLVGQYTFGFVIYHIHSKFIYFSNPLFLNNYYLALWIYVIASIVAWVIFFKLSKLLSKVNI